MTGPDGALVEVRDVWRRYRLAPGGRSSTLRGTIARGRRGSGQQWFWALQGVDLRLLRGEAVAVIGANGAGKSTLLRLAGGVGRPDRGKVHVSGRIGAMLDLGREFHPDLTGRQNAELAAVVAGLTRRQFRERFDVMLDFSGLHDFADQPLHTYSDGMRARLAFSVLAHVEPDALLVDEVLAVGDAAFQRRSVDRMDQLRERGVGIVFVSHDLDLVRRVCDTAVWLDAGLVRRSGDAADVVHEYIESTGTTTPPASSGSSRLVDLADVEVLDGWGVPCATVRTGAPLSVRWRVDATLAGQPLRVSLTLARQAAEIVSIDTSTTMEPGAEELRVDFDRVDLAPGRYDVQVALFDRSWRRQLAHQRVPLQVRGDGPDRAFLAPPHQWSRRSLPHDQPGS